MRFYDISAPIFSEMPVYKDKPEKKPKIETVLNGYVTESRLEIDVHSGTHIDSPLHMFPESKGIESIDLDQILGPCKVVNLQKVQDKITKKDLQELDLKNGDFVLFQTRNSSEDFFNFKFIYLSEEGAKYLVEIGVRGVGTDALGIERDQPGHPTHKTLFAQNVIIIEGLRLANIPPGEYLLIAAPLKLQGTEAAPARVLLIEGKSI